MTTSRPRGERPRMPDYGVDTGEWSPLDWSWAAERLLACRNFWVVTASASGRPHALPVWGVWDDADLRFAFSCGPRSRKAANIRANPQVVVAVDSTIECVSVEGRASEVKGSRADAWVERYLKKYFPGEPSLTAEFLAENLLFEVRPDRAFAVIERPDEFATRATRWQFPDA